MKSTIILAVIVVSCVSTSVAQQASRERSQRGPHNCHMRQVDACFYSIVSLTSQVANVITTESGVNQFCSTVSSSVSCLKTYLRRCSTPLQREMFNFFSDQFTSRVDEFCNSTNLKSQLLTHSPCIQSSVFNNQQYKATCVNDLLAAFDKGRQLVTGQRSINDVLTSISSLNDRIFASDALLDVSCCGFNRFTRCFQQRVDNSCGKDAVTAIDMFTSRTFGVAMDKICPAKLFDVTGEKCRSILPTEGSKADLGTLNDNPFGKYVMQYLGFLFDSPIQN